MITIPTTLILGAGSNQHLGYPVGKEFINSICERISAKNYSDEIKSEFTPEEIKLFYLHLSRSLPTSIDAFLEQNDEFLNIGKYFIVECLKQFENPIRLFSPSNAGWYELLFNVLSTPSIEKISNNKLSIITFNYDRSLEFFLHQVIKYTKKVSDVEALDILKHLTIIHPHGVLGDFPNVPYYHVIEEISLSELSENINIISEVKDSGKDFCSKEFQDSYSCLKNSERIYFLGFGFHEDNIRRFNFFTKETISDRKVFSTTIGIMARFREDLLKRLEPYGFTKDNFPRSQRDCKALLENEIRLK